MNLDSGCTKKHQENRNSLLFGHKKETCHVFYYVLLNIYFGHNGHLDVQVFLVL